MTIRRVRSGLPRQLILSASMLLMVGCIQQPVHKEEGERAYLRSWSRILLVNGQPPADSFRVELPPGRQVLEVLHETYRENIYCRFEFEARVGESYEIVDHTNPEPLVLYRWKRANRLWAERLYPQLPESCEKRAR